MLLVKNKTRSDSSNLMTSLSNKTKFQSVLYQKVLPYCFAEIIVKIFFQRISDSHFISANFEHDGFYEIKEALD